MANERVTLLDLSFPDAPHNLAFEEALLDEAEERSLGGFLRFWEAPTPFVVLGYGKKAGQEVNMDLAKSREIPVLRRCTGGGTVLQGPGCLNYALILPVDYHSSLETITGTNHFVMAQQRTAIQNLPGSKGIIEVNGHTDLTFNGLKFSGNAQRRKRSYLLFHGSFLLDYDLTLIEKVLKMPLQQPEYRQHRRHLEFICNLPVTREDLKESLKKVWHAVAQSPSNDALQVNLESRIEKLTREKYGNEDWNLKL